MKEPSNARRLFLLEKREHRGLTSIEALELKKLQRKLELWIDKHYPPSDYHIKRMEKVLRKKKNGKAKRVNS